ncbi:MAG: regulatory protein RecX [Terriglobales bacterium]
MKARPPQKLDGDDLYRKAVSLLARSGRSEAELRRALARRATAPAELDAALARLRDHGYLDDARLAASFTLFQKDVARHGRLRTLRDLRARGVSTAIAEAAVRHTYAGSSEDALLRAHLHAKRLRPPQDLRQAASLCRKLLRAGFSSAACQRALRAWKLDPDWIDALAAPEEESQ